MSSITVKTIWQEWGSSTLTFLGLLSVGLLGHQTHWTFAFAGHDHSHDEAATVLHEESGANAEATPGNSSIELSSTQARSKAGIETSVAFLREMNAEVRVNGMLDYDRRVVTKVAPRASGVVWRIDKHWGDTVKAGEILAILDSAEVGQLKAEFLNALVTDQLKSETASMLEKLIETIPERQIREARAAAKEASIRLLNAEQMLINLGIPVSVEEFRGLSTTEQAKRIRTMGLEHVIPSEKATSSNLLPLVAPFDGMIVSRDVGLGEVVSESQVLFEVADVTRMWILLDVPKEYANLIQISQPITFRPDGFDEDVGARVAWISSEVDRQTRTLTVRGEISREFRPAGLVSLPVLRANTFGAGKIRVRQNATAVVVPKTAIQDDGTGTFVFVQESETVFRPVKVEIGVSDGDLVEVISGLEAGQAVASRGGHSLKSQMVLARLMGSSL